MARTLEGQRVLVVGASAGIGREFARQAVQDGAQVLLAARRLDRLTELAAGGRRRACRWSSTSPTRLVRGAGRDDAAPSSARSTSSSAAPATRRCGTSPTSPRRTGRRCSGINVIGIHQLIRAVLPVTTEGGLIAVLSSESTSAPRHALGVYTSSKVALEMSMRVWRQEQPRARFTTLVVGGTFPTDFGADFDMEILLPAMEAWARIGTIQEKLMATEEVAAVIRGTLASIVDLPDISLDQVVIRSPSPVVGGAEQLQAEAEENIGRLQESSAERRTSGATRRLQRRWSR